MTVEQTTHSPREAEARTIKALALVQVLVAHGATADEARALPAAGRRMAETLAGTRPASDATWTVAVTVLSRRAEFAADPFAAL